VRVWSYALNNAMRRNRREVAMRKNRGFISALVLVTIATVSCAQIADKKEANSSAAAGPELRWKYETGG